VRLRNLCIAHFTRQNVSSLSCLLVSLGNHATPALHRGLPDLQIDEDLRLNRELVRKAVALGLPSFRRPRRGVFEIGDVHKAMPGLKHSNFPFDRRSLDEQLGIQCGTSDLINYSLAQATEDGIRQSPRAHNKHDQGNKQQEIHDPRFNQFHSSF